MRQKAVIVSGSLCAAGICFAVFLWMVAGRVEHLLVRRQVCCVRVAHADACADSGRRTDSTMGFSTALRASQKPHFDLLANAIAAPVAIVSAVNFIRWWGLAGRGSEHGGGLCCLHGHQRLDFLCGVRRRMRTGEGGDGGEAA